MERGEDVCTRVTLIYGHSVGGRLGYCTTNSGSIGHDEDWGGTDEEICIVLGLQMNPFRILMIFSSTFFPFVMHFGNHCGRQWDTHPSATVYYLHVRKNRRTENYECMKTYKVAHPRSYWELWITYVEHNFRKWASEFAYYQITISDFYTTRTI